MTKKLAQILTIFKRLNTKIIIYFLSFAFLPLLIFSIFGYYLNKDLITRINLDHLRSLNATSAQEFNIYLQSKNRIIIQVLKDFKSLEKTGSLQSFLNSRDELFPDFVRLEVLPSAFDSIQQEKIVRKLVADAEPAILFRIEEVQIAGYVPHEEIGELIRSNVKEIQNIVYFLNSEKKLTKNSIESIKKDEILLLTKQISQQDKRGKEYLFEEEGYLASITFDSDQNIFIVTRIDNQIFYAELISFRNKILLANIVFAMILIMLAIVFSRHITTPIHKLVELFKILVAVI